MGVLYTFDVKTPLREAKKKRQRTIMYDVMKFKNDCSESGVIVNGESERLINARNASCAMLYESGQKDNWK